MPFIKKAKLHDQTETNESRLLAAAIRCFEKFGIEKTFIEDIAKEAGVSRQTAYRVFGNRRALLLNVANHRLARLEAKLRPRVSRADSFEEALVKGALLSLRMGKGDKIFNAILKSLGGVGVERYMLHSKSPLIATTANIWDDVIDKARASGELRANLTKNEVVTWLVSVGCLLMLKDELNTKGREDFVRKFMIPALVENKHSTA